MSYCGACESCVRIGPPQVDEPPALTQEQVDQIEDQIEELMLVRRMGKDAARSGDPAIRAEALRGVAQCNDDLKALRALLAKEA